MTIWLRLIMPMLFLGGCAAAVTIMAAQRNAAEVALDAERRSHAGTIASYRIAANVARARDSENRQLTEKLQVQISERATHDYEDRISAVRVRVERLRAPAAAASGGDASGPHLPTVSASAVSPDAPPACPGLSVDAARIASEQAIQLDALIDWVERQQAAAQIEEEPDDEQF